MSLKPKMCALASKKAKKAVRGRRSPGQLSFFSEGDSFLSPSPLGHRRARVAKGWSSHICLELIDLWIFKHPQWPKTTWWVSPARWPSARRIGRSEKRAGNGKARGTSAGVSRVAG